MYNVFILSELIYKYIIWLLELKIHNIVFATAIYYWNRSHLLKLLSGIKLLTLYIYNYILSITKTDFETINSKMYTQMQIYSFFYLSFDMQSVNNKYLLINIYILSF